MSRVLPSKQQLHFVMFPWFAYGHMTPYLHLSNELAKRGHKITFLLPAGDKPLHRLQAMNHHPDLITFTPIQLPHIPNLPPTAVTASDIPIELATLLATAVDQTRPKVEEIVTLLRPNFVLYDFAYWITHITSKLGIISICYNVISAATLALTCVPAAATASNKPGRKSSSKDEEKLLAPPPGYPSTKVLLRKHESRSLNLIWEEFGSGSCLTLQERIISAMTTCDVIAIRTCKEIEGKFCDYLTSQFNHRQPVLLTGPVLPPDTNNKLLHPKWMEWLSQFRESEVIYCAFGSQVIFEKEQLLEILHGLELTGLPFFAVLSPPQGCSTINEVLSEQFNERISGRGVVYDGWVEQPAVLSHPAVGCFVNHCGFGTMWEGMRSQCQIVLAPQLVDQILNTRIMAEEMGVAVEVKRGDNGWISKWDLCEAVKMVMDKGSEVGDLVRKNHAIWKERLCGDGFMEDYVDQFVKSLERLLVEVQSNGEGN